MPLRPDEPPAYAARLLESTIVELVSHGAIALPHQSTVELAAPLRVYHLGADAVAAGRGLAAVTPVGWWIQVRSEGTMLGAMEVADVVGATRGQPPLRFASFTTGALQRGLAAEVGRASSRSGSSEVPAAVVRAPALYLMALWLREASGDVLIPIAPAPDEVQPGQAAPAEDVLAALRASAQAAISAPEDGN